MLNGNVSLHGRYCQATGVLANMKATFAPSSGSRTLLLEGRPRVFTRTNARMAKICAAGCFLPLASARNIGDLTNDAHAKLAREEEGEGAHSLPRAKPCAQQNTRGARDRGMEETRRAHIARAHTRTSM